MQLFLNELQVSFKELIELDVLDGSPINWHLQSPISSSLKAQYSLLSEKFDNMARPHKNQILITLYKFEAFSSLFVHGNLDRDLAKEIIGHTFSRQVSILIGIISYFRKTNESVFGLNTIKLYNEWKIENNGE